MSEDCNIVGLTSHWAETSQEQNVPWPNLPETEMSKVRCQNISWPKMSIGRNVPEAKYPVDETSGDRHVPVPK